MGNFAENLNLGKRVLPPPPVEDHQSLNGAGLNAVIELPPADDCNYIRKLKWAICHYYNFCPPPRM